MTTSGLIKHPNLVSIKPAAAQTDQAELARDIRFDFDKASKKLAKRAINGQEAAVQYLKTQV